MDNGVDLADLRLNRLHATEAALAFGLELGVQFLLLGGHLGVVLGLQLAGPRLELRLEALGDVPVEKRVELVAQGVLAFLDLSGARSSSVRSTTTATKSRTTDQDMEIGAELIGSDQVRGQMDATALRRRQRALLEILDRNIGTPRQPERKAQQRRF